MAHFSTIEIKVKVKLSLWSAIKMRIAGLHRLHGVTINELIEAKREMERAK